MVFSDHVSPVDDLVNGLLRLKINSAAITGLVLHSLRDTHVKDFQAVKIKVLVCSIKAASVGLTLTAARNVVFNDLSWVPADLEQARKRIHRIGQEHPCMVHYISMGDIDRGIQERIIEKSRLIKEIV